MVETSAISALESAAADLGKLLNGWTSNLLAESEAAESDPANPDARSRRPDLATINDGIQSLWRLVSVQKSIQQLKNPPSATAPSPDRPAPQFRFGVQASACPGNLPQAAAQFPSAAEPNDKPQINVASAPSTVAHNSSFNLHTSVPSVPVVSSAPTLNSIEAIAAKTEKLYAETLELISASGLPVPVNADLPIGNSPLGRVAFPGSADPNRKPTDQIKTKLLDAITNRPIFPGARNFLDSLRAELQTSPP